MINKKTSRTRGIKKTKCFLSKLSDILNDITYQDIISWNKEGNGIIIKSTNNLCKVVLPKFYKHSNYSSFVRQLNIYGFYKSQGILKDGEGFEHDIFCKNVTKEQIRQIILQNRRKKRLSNDISLIKDDLDINDNLDNSNDIKEYILLGEKEKNNSNIINDLKKEIKDLHNKNKLLNGNVQECQNIINILNYKNLMDIVFF